METELLNAAAFHGWHESLSEYWVSAAFALLFLGSFLILFCMQLKEEFGRKDSSWQFAAKDLNRSLWPNKSHLACSYWADSGMRTYMEDRYSINGQLNGNTDATFYGVYDGHGGSVAAQFVADNLCNVLLAQKNFHQSTTDALKTAFVEVDKQFEELCQREGISDGTTAVAALVMGNTIVVANAGDSRAILVQRSGTSIPLSHDHKPSRQDELRRITSLGGKVVFWGRWRVEGILAVSRAIGDRNLKPYVISDPEIVEWVIGEDDVYLVLASDGIWDVMTNKEVGDFVLGAHGMKWIARELCDEAFHRGSTDNVCAIVIALKDKKIAAIGNCENIPLKEQTKPISRNG